MGTAIDLKTKITESEATRTISASEEIDYADLAETMTLDKVMESCRRLSRKNKGVIGAFIEALIRKESETASKYLEVEKLLAKQEKTNLELSARLSKLEETVAAGPKIPAPTYDE